MTGSHRVCTPAFIAATARQDVQRQTARQAIQNAFHVREHEMVLGHVELAHVLRQARGGGLLPREIVRGLFAIAQRQGGIEIQVARLLRHLNEVWNGNFPQRVASALGFLHILGEQTGIGLADLGELFTRTEMDDLIHFQAFVRLAPTENRYLDHDKAINRLVFLELGRT